MLSNDEVPQIITDCENRESKLSDWERTFIDSVKTQTTNGRALTEAQKSRLEVIWDKVTG